VLVNLPFKVGRNGDHAALRTMKDHMPTTTPNQISAITAPQTMLVSQLVARCAAIDGAETADYDEQICESRLADLLV
jgi:hypothetical protein